MWVDSTIADAYWSQVQGSLFHTFEGVGFWGFPCGEKLPSFELQIGEGKAIIPGELLNAGYLNDTGAIPRESPLHLFYQYTWNFLSRYIQSFRQTLSQWLCLYP